MKKVLPQVGFEPWTSYLQHIIVTERFWVRMSIFSCTKNCKFFLLCDWLELPLWSDSATLQQHSRVGVTLRIISFRTRVRLALGRHTIFSVQTGNNSSIPISPERTIQMGPFSQNRALFCCVDKWHNNSRAFQFWQSEPRRVIQSSTWKCIASTSIPASNLSSSWFLITRRS